MSRKRSFVAITGASESACGYCHSSDSSKTSFGMWAYQGLTAATYQSLLDRGWRRSGQYLYKPDLATTCCPQYTIRQLSLRSACSRGQKKVLKKMRRFLATGVRPGAAAAAAAAGGGVALAGNKDDSKDDDDDASDVAMDGDVPADNQFLQPATAVPTASTIQAASVSASMVQDSLQDRKDLASIKSQSSGPDPKTKLAGQQQQQQQQPHGAKKGKASQMATASLVDLIKQTESPGQPQKHVLKVTLIRSKFEQDTFELYKKYQIAIHKDPPSRITPEQFTQFLVDSPIQAETVYTATTSGDPLSNSSIISGFDPTAIAYGSFHQKYYMDDRLIAVAVLDILPSCVSAVYFMYDPDFYFLSLGTYSALREAALTASIAKFVPNIQYYYMGYYIHSCQKMRYKAGFKPCDLLCPVRLNLISRLNLCEFTRLMHVILKETYKWVPVEAAIKLLEQKPSTAFYDVPDPEQEPIVLSQPRAIRVQNTSDVKLKDISNAVILYEQALYKLLACPKRPDIEEQIRELFLA
eukprot:jgi/Hompol1/5663/HPOL_002051-RA